MRAYLMLTIVLTGLTGMPAAMAAPFENDAALAADDLDGWRGGTDLGSGNLFQTNESALSAGNIGSISVAGTAAKQSGLINPAQVMGNNGITAVMQNTGDMVNMNNATSVNVYMR